MPATLTELVASFKTRPNNWLFSVVLAEVDYEEGLNSYQKMGIALSVFLDAGKTSDEITTFRNDLKQKFSIPDDQFEEFMRASRPEPGKLSAERVIGIYAKAKQSIKLGAWAIDHRSTLKPMSLNAIAKNLPAGAKNEKETEVELQNRIIRVFATLALSRQLDLEDLSREVVRTRVTANIINGEIKSLMADGKPWDAVSYTDLSHLLAIKGIEKSENQLIKFIDEHRSLFPELYTRPHRYSSKLSLEDIQQIFLLGKYTSMTHQQIAERFGLETASAITRILQENPPLDSDGKPIIVTLGHKKTFTPTEEDLIRTLHAQKVSPAAIAERINQERKNRGETTLLPVHTVYNVIRR